MARKVKPIDYSLKSEVTRHLQECNYVSASYSAYLFAESLRKNGVYEEAAKYYTLALYIDVSGLNASGGIDRIEKVFIGVRVLNGLRTAVEKANNLAECIEEAYTVSLPFRYFESDTFKYILTHGLTGGYEDLPHNEPPKELLSGTRYDDEDESQYDLPYDEWYAQYVQPEIDQVHAQRNALEADFEELEILEALENE
jgi:hypothetical protein